MFYQFGSDGPLAFCLYSSSCRVSHAVLRFLGCSLIGGLYANFSSGIIIVEGRIYVNIAFSI